MNTRRPRNPGPTTPVKRRRDRNLPVSVESPYFSPSKERPSDENFLIVDSERQLQSPTTKTDQTNRTLDFPHNYASESDDPFEATQTRIPASPVGISGLYRQLALCKPCLIQGISFLTVIIYELI